MKERLLSLDLLRGIIIILMIFINLFDETALEALIFSERGRAIDFGVTSLLPNVFVFLMGFFLIVANKFTAKNLLTKAILLLVLGYALNIIRYPVFMYLAGYSSTLSKSFAANMYYVHMVDIYIFAGYACLLLAPLTWLPPITAHAYTSFAAFIMYLSSQTNSVRECLSLLPDGILSYVEHIFLPISGNVYFPMIPWLAYILLGIACGLFYQTTDKTNFFKKLTLYGVLTSICGYMLFAKAHDVATFKMRADFYQQDYSVGIMIMGITLIAPVLSEFFLTKLPRLVRALLTYTSRHIILMYCLSWLIIAYLKFVQGWSNSLNLSETIMYTALIYAVCLLVAKLQDLLTIRKSPALTKNNS